MEKQRRDDKRKSIPDWATSASSIDEEMDEASARAEAEERKEAEKVEDEKLPDVLFFSFSTF